MNCAIYTRVSTDKQTTDNQRGVLERLAAQRGLTVVRVVEEVESGARHRPALESLLKAGGYSVLLIWALDRLGRGGALEALSIMEGLSRKGVSVVSAQESWLDTSADNPMRDVLIAFSATIAKMERARLISRTKAGLETARKNGKVLGRPSERMPSKEEREVIVRAWRTAGGTYRQLGMRLGGVGPATAMRVAKGVAA
jgi:putative DNA-invertase from lambdoid prophage Rac